MNTEKLIAEMKGLFVLGEPVTIAESDLLHRCIALVRKHAEKTGFDLATAGEVERTCATCADDIEPFSHCFEIGCAASDRSKWRPKVKKNDTPISQDEQDMAVSVLAEPAEKPEAKPITAEELLPVIRAIVRDIDVGCLTLNGKRELAKLEVRK